MQDLNDLYYFAAVVDHGGSRRPGALDIPKSADRQSLCSNNGSASG